MIAVFFQRIILERWCAHLHSKFINHFTFAMQPLARRLLKSQLHLELLAANLGNFLLVPLVPRLKVVISFCNNCNKFLF